VQRVIGHFVGADVLLHFVKGPVEEWVVFDDLLVSSHSKRGKSWRLADCSARKPVIQMELLRNARRNGSTLRIKQHVFLNSTAS
jgi:hypothetical protein